MKAKENWKPVTIGGVAGIVLGAGTVYAVQPTQHTEQEAMPVGNGTPAESQETAVATVSDDMSFAEAFSTAREQTGPGGVFVWRGNVYGTYMADEWQAMTAEEKDLFASNAGSVVRPVSAEVPTQMEEEMPLAAEDAEPVESKEGEVLPDATSWDELAQEENDVRVVGYEEIEISDGHYAPMEELEINGQRVAIIDIDNDGTADIAMTDLNHNNQMDEGEVIDLHTGESITFANDDQPMAAPEEDLASLEEDAAPAADTDLCAF